MIKGNSFKLSDKWFRVEREISADKSRGYE
jgi:hypothetical protein